MRHGQARLAANYVPLQVSGRHVQAGSRPFESPDQLRDLCKELADTHVLLRRGAAVLDVPLPGKEPYGGAVTTLDLDGRDRDVTSRLVTAALITVFTHTWGYRL